MSKPTKRPDSTKKGHISSEHTQSEPRNTESVAKNANKSKNYELSKPENADQMVKNDDNSTTTSCELQNKYPNSKSGGSSPTSSIQFEPKRKNPAIKSTVESTSNNSSLHSSKVQTNSELQSISKGTKMNYGAVSTNKKANEANSNSSSASNSSQNNSLEGTNAPLRPHTGGDGRWDAINMISNKGGPLDLSNFRLFKRLGYGDIGSVYLVQLRGTDAYFAMKVMDKVSLASRNKLLRAQTEREILRLLDHPFLPSLYSYFETNKFYCLVIEYCSGGNLYSLRQKQTNNHFTEDAARFYATEVLLALEYLHMLGIVYRDLKPENVLVRDEGHIMLSDFDLSLRCSVNPTLVKSLYVHANNNSSAGLLDDEYAMQGCMQPTNFFPRILPTKKNRKSKFDFGLFVGGSLPELMAEPTNVRSMSFVGTHEYLAPEIIRGEGHGSAVDWWTFGIFLYELLHGTTPFKGQGNQATLINVVGQPLRFPETPQVSIVARDLIGRLLVKEQHMRIAYQRGATEIKQHPFFEGVNWALVRSAQPPHIPDSVDFSQFACKEANHPEKNKVPQVKCDKDNNNNSSNDYVEFEYF